VPPAVPIRPTEFFQHATTGWPKKVSHYHESSLKGIKTSHLGYILLQFRLQNEHKNMASLY